MNWLKGKKTYLLALAAIITIATQYISGDIDASKAVVELLTALGLITARVGASSDVKKALSDSESKDNLDVDKNAK